MYNCYEIDADLVDVGHGLFKVGVAKLSVHYAGNYKLQSPILKFLDPPL